MTSIATTLAFGEELEFPLSVRTLSDFRVWTRSAAFPERGRIDYIRGRIEVDRAPENIWFHSQPKTEVARVIANTVKARNLGYVGIDCTRITSELSDLSAEPDVVLIRTESITSRRVRLVESASGGEEDFVEIEGPADLVVEVVSRASAKKDVKELPPAYFDAGVDEIWLVDVRKGRFLFRIHHRGETEWKAAPMRDDGSQKSLVLDR